MTRRLLGIVLLTCAGAAVPAAAATPSSSPSLRLRFPQRVEKGQHLALGGKIQGRGTVRVVLEERVNHRWHRLGSYVSHLPDDFGIRRTVPHTARRYALRVRLKRGGRVLAQRLRAWKVAKPVPWEQRVALAVLNPVAYLLLFGLSVGLLVVMVGGFGAYVLAIIFGVLEAIYEALEFWGVILLLAAPFLIGAIILGR